MFFSVVDSRGQIQIIKATYLRGSQIADKNLCAIALKNRERLYYESETLCQKMLQFLCYLNQQDWLAKSLLSLVRILFEGDEVINSKIDEIKISFDNKLKADSEKGVTPISIEEYNKIHLIKESNTKVASIINACHDWVLSNHKDFARFPNSNEWQRFLNSPLDGQLTLSFALQWRYNFGSLFKELPLLV